MKLKYLFCALLMLGTVLAAGCAGAGKGTEAGETARPEETDGVTVRPEETDGGDVRTSQEAAPGTAGRLDVERYNLGQGRREEIITRCTQLAQLCAEEMDRAKTERSEFFPYETVMARESIDAVEDLLAGAGTAVLNTDGVYPEYLENSGGLRDFAEAVRSGGEARQELVSVTRWRGLNYALFEYKDGEMEHICASVSWEEDGSFTISEPYRETVRDWGTVGDEFFYYQIYPFDWHWDACTPVRLESADRELYDMCAKYVLPLGYQGTNIFLVDWDGADMGALSLNDVFEYLYMARHGERVDEESLEFLTERECCVVPAELFEETVLPYFDLSAQEMRDRAMYMAETDAYPWQPVISTKISYFPTVTPEVTECRDNGDGTLTLTVEVLCFEEKCFPLFVHELTVRPGEDGSFEYLGNRLTYLSGHALPNAVPRLER